MIDGGAIICLLVQIVNLRILFKYSRRLEANSSFILRGTVLDSISDSVTTKTSDLLSISPTFIQLLGTERNSTTITDEEKQSSLQK